MPDHPHDAPAGGFRTFATASRFGVASGLLLSLLAFGPYAVPALRADWLQVSDAWLLAVALPCLAATWLAMRAERRRRGDPLRFASALATGVAVALAAAATTGLAAYLVHVTAGPALGDALYAAQVAQLGADVASDSAAAQAMAELEAARPMFGHPGLQAMLAAGTVVALGVIVSLVAALLLRGGGARRA